MKVYQERTMLICIAILLTAVASGRAELSLGQLRAKFESAVGEKNEERDASVDRLREGYLGALNRLKVELGREGRLEAAAVVLRESENVQRGAELALLPEGVDYRIQNLRRKWEEASTKTTTEHANAVVGLSKKYLRELEERKQKLTREGKIREALVVDGEIKRVDGLDWLGAARRESGAIDEKPADSQSLRELLPGTRWAHRLSTRDEADGELTFKDSRAASFKAKRGGTIPMRWSVVDENTVRVTCDLWSHPLVVKFNPAREEYVGTMTGETATRIGKLINKE